MSGKFLNFAANQKRFRPVDIKDSGLLMLMWIDLLAPGLVEKSDR